MKAARNWARRLAASTIAGVALAACARPPAQPGQPEWQAPTHVPEPTPQSAAAGWQARTIYETEDGPFGDGGGDINRDGRPDIIVASRNLHGDDTTGVRANRVAAISPREPATLCEWRGGVGFGYRLAMAGDVDADGSSDVLVTEGDRPKTDSARVWVFSGSTSDVLFTCSGDYIGDDAAGLGDLDSDGCADMGFTTVEGLHREHEAHLPSGEFGFEVHSGRDGHLLLRQSYHGVSYYPGFQGLRAFGDLDADGTPDILAAIPADTPNGFNENRVIVISGADGSTLLELPSGEVSGEAHESLACAGDADGDGAPDLLVGCARRDEARIVSGRTGCTLQLVEGELDSSFGWAVAALGDADGDDVADIAIGAPRFATPTMAPGYAVVCSGRTGSELIRLDGEREGGAFDDGFMLGICVRACGDVDGDGRADVLIGEDRYFGFNSSTAPDRVLVVGLQRR